MPKLVHLHRKQNLQNQPNRRMTPWFQVQIHQRKHRNRNGTILEEPDDDNISLGDLTGDGMIAVDDAVFVLTIYAKMAAGAEVNLTPNQFFYSDCNHDGKVDVTDAVLILEYYAKRAAGATELLFQITLTRKTNNRKPPQRQLLQQNPFRWKQRPRLVSTEMTESVTTEPTTEAITTTIQPTTTTNHF